MCTSSRRARGRASDGGFSLIEIVIAMGLLSVVLVASLPMMLSMLASTVTTKMNTQAKNLSQERLEQLRDLRFHVAQQNGPFLDILDLYYTNAFAAGTPTTLVAGAGTLTGRYYSTGTRMGVAAPLYEVKTGQLPGAQQFSQTVVAQFIDSAGGVVPKTRFENTYDSQDQGTDGPPSLVLRLTVVTEWVQAGQPKSYRTATVITDGQPEQPSIQTQAQAVAVVVSSSASDATTLKLQGGVANLDGSQSSGSAVSGYVTGALATRTGTTAVTGQVGEWSLPAQAATLTGSTAAQASGGSCSWSAFGPNSVTNGTADVSAGLPRSPANVDDAGGPKVSTGTITDGSASSCGMLAFDNTTGGGVGLSTGSGLGRHMGVGPYVVVPTPVAPTLGKIAGSAYVTASALTAVPQLSRAGGRIAMNQPVVLFPQFAASGGRGLVSGRISSGSVDCTSGAGGPGTVVGKYTLVLEWWGRGPADPAERWHSATYTYDSANTSTPLTVSGDLWQPALTVLDDGTLLSQLVQGVAPSTTAGVVATGATTGLRGFPTGILTLTTAGTLTNESSPGFSAIKVQLGQLSCVADDQR